MNSTQLNGTTSTTFSQPPSNLFAKLGSVPRLAKNMTTRKHPSKDCLNQNIFLNKPRCFYPRNFNNSTLFSYKNKWLVKSNASSKMLVNIMKKILTKNEPLGLHFILRQRAETKNKTEKMQNSNDSFHDS